MRKVLFLPLLLLVFPLIAFAEVSVSTTGDSNVTVNQETSGQSTTCVNGKCTTAGGESKSKVCVNGNCYESSGDLDVNEGNAQINIKNSNGTNSISVKSSGNSNTSVNVDTTLGDEKKVIKKIQETRMSILDKFKEFLTRLFPFFKL